MNYYIDFDNTLYNTPKLTERMINSIIDSMVEQKRLDKKILYKECKSNFNKENIYNIYILAEQLATKYGLDLSPIISNLNSVILNGNDLVFDDVIPFLKKIKSKKHRLYMLSFSKDNLQYQSAKISGSGLADYFDALFITSVPKYKLDINYKNGIFIDDQPTDLLGLYSKKPKEVIRLRRKENKYSKKELNNENIKEYIDLYQVDIF